MAGIKISDVWKKTPKLTKVIFAVTGIFVLLVIFNVSSYLRGPAPYFPDWQWGFLYVNTWNRVWAPLAVGSLLLYLAYYFECKIRNTKTFHLSIFLTFIVLLGILFNVSITFFSRSGTNANLERIIDEGNNGYFSTSNEVGDLGTFLSTFDKKVLNFHQHAQGHPPGAILVHVGLTGLSKTFFGGINTLTIPQPKTLKIAAIWNGLSPAQKVSALLSIIVILILSNLTPVIVFFVGKQIADVTVGIRAAVASALIPAASFFYPLPDVYFPLFGLLTFLFLTKGLKKNSIGYVAITAIIFAIGLFFSFSLLPLSLFYLLYILFYHLKYHLSFRNLISTLSVFFGTFAFFYLSIFVATNYNVIQVFQTVLSGLPEHRKYLTWLFYNPYDFFIFTGIPLSILFICASCKAFKKENLRAMLQSKSSRIELLAFCLMLFTLILSGTVRGEVGRIWIPYMPFVALFGIQFLTGYYGKKSFWVFVVCMALLIVQTLVLQEFWVMLW